MNLEDLYDVISDKETVLEARLKLLVDLETSSENQDGNSNPSNRDFIATALKASIQSLQADINELNVELMKAVRGK